MLKRLLGDRGEVEAGQGSMAAASAEAAIHPVEPDSGVRRLGWLVIAGVVIILVGAAATLSRLPGLWGSDRPASQAAPTATRLGDLPGAGDTASAPAGTPTNSAAVPLPPGGRGDSGTGPGMSDGPTSGVPGQAATPGGSNTAPAGPAGSGVTLPAYNDPENTAAPTATTTLPADVQAALSVLSAVIKVQVDTGQLDPVAGSDLQGKVHQVAREVSEGNWAGARYYADRIRVKLGKYLADGLVTATGYRALISSLDVLDAALS